ncbi:YihY/virulence factor BrkB family protein [Roseivivax marinus]|uniref:YihY/virulence factor BrkB family protein n=1 Tax=Roseivivax marinus TaxID=1379903 RepID=UPI0004B82E69|nr:YihY/virulence factor BrkB family protein [Roseivivax marinus]
MSKTNQRGRRAERPGQIPARGWWDIGLRVYRELSRDHVSVVSAGVAFFGLLALFPAIGALMSTAGLLMDPATIELQLEELVAILPKDAAEILQGQARAVASNGGTSLGLAALAGLALSIYGASKGMSTLMEGMNIAYDEEETRGMIKQYAVSFALTVFLILGVLVSLGLTVAVPALIGSLGLPDALTTLLDWGRWPLLAALTVIGLAVLYRYGPSRQDPEWRWVTWGSVIAMVFWIAGSIAFSLYVRDFGDYNESYGAIGGVIVLLTWLWLSAYIVLLGAEINSEMEHQTRHDSTTGRELPMGKRGAVKADHVGEAQ